MNPAIQAASVHPVQSRVSAEEWQTRVDLAACYRLVAAVWLDRSGVHPHHGQDSRHRADHFLINPYGMLFDEITASSLVKIDLAGNKLDDSPYPVNPAGFVIHSAIHAARDDAKCVLHTHTANGVAVAAQKSGVLPHLAAKHLRAVQPRVSRLRGRGAQ